MNTITPNYNERSWAIDLIGLLKQLASQNNRSIKDAGGEQTIRTEGSSLFPDVLLFGDRATARILQGWELKMPDTPIDDIDFFKNAKEKAIALGLDSFVLWNVSHAKLFVKSTGNQFNCSKQWSALSDLTTRSSVISNRTRWEALANEIFFYLSDLFDRGALEGRQFIDAYRSGGVTALIMENAGEVTNLLIEASRTDIQLRAGITIWWNKYRAEYAGGEMYAVLAQAVISNWIGKILFAHILREQDQRAQQVAAINDTTTPQEALRLFQRLSQDCNFWTIFSDSLGLSKISGKAWDQLKQFNKLLGDLRVGSVDQAQLSGILEATVEVAIRKLRGQYPTPITLARLLVRLCIRNIVTDRIIDPCCGSGTIARAAQEQKIYAQIPPAQVSQTVFAGDQDPQAIQIATFALTKPALMHMPLRIFQQDAFSLSPDLSIEYRNPSTGEVFAETLGTFDAITSNLPFVAQEGRRQYGNALRNVVEKMATGTDFTGRADIAAYLPFAFHSILNEGGRLGIIITNAWLGTDWGDDFYKLLGQYYKLKSVVTSGAGRWFKNSEVVTNILIMEKIAPNQHNSENINFIVLTRPLEEISDIDTVELVSAQIEMGVTQIDTMTVRSVSLPDIERFRTLGLGGNAQFTNCDWILQLPLVPLRNFFDVKRGERRGKNELFYPRQDHGIEPEYIKPLAKSPTDFKKLKMNAIKEAFVCSLSEDELQSLGHTGALNWISQFKTEENIEKLSRSRKHWYQMDAETLADLVMFINYGDRLFIGRVDPPAFSDQRLVPLKAKENIDIDLHHALLNCTVIMFMIEGMGFGRGLGALDLNKDRLEKFMHVLNAQLLDAVAIENIKAAFNPLLERDILPIADELEKSDRRHFDTIVLNSFNIQINIDDIYSSLLSLAEIRRTATD